MTPLADYQVVVRRRKKYIMSNLMTEDDFNFLLNSPHRSYYEGRWEYFSVVLRMIEDIHPNRVLEIGPGWMPVVRDADLMYTPE
jgi:hypothetical protein